MTKSAAPRKGSLDPFNAAGITNAALSEGQAEHMRELAALKPEEKCSCGWYRKGECRDCKKAQFTPGGRQ